MLNRIELIGNVGHTPEVKEAGGVKVARMSLGVTQRGYTKKDGTKVEDKTEWFYLEAWRGLAEIAERYVSKGDKLYVAGRMESRKYTGKDGVEKTAWEVKVETIELLTSKSASQQEAAGQPAPQQMEQQQSAPVAEMNDLPF